jgi:hypothetical protein
MSDPTSTVIAQIANADTDRKKELEAKKPPPGDEQKSEAPPLQCYKCLVNLYEGNKSQKKGFYYPEGPMCLPCQGHYEVCAYQKQKTYRFLHPELFPLGNWEELISTPIVCITCTQYDFCEDSERRKDGKVQLVDLERLCSICNGFNCSICVPHGKETASGFVCMFCAFETPPECDIGFCDDCVKQLKKAEVEVKQSTIEHAGRGLFCFVMT